LIFTRNGALWGVYGHSHITYFENTDILGGAHAPFLKKFLSKNDAWGEFMTLNNAWNAV
jgi:hypothetical protein